MHGEASRRDRAIFEAGSGGFLVLLRFCALQVTALEGRVVPLAFTTFGRGPSLALQMTPSFWSSMDRPPITAFRQDPMLSNGTGSVMKLGIMHAIVRLRILLSQAFVQPALARLLTPHREITRRIQRGHVFAGFSSS